MDRDTIERQLRQVGRYLDEKGLVGEILLLKSIHDNRIGNAGFARRIPRSRCDCRESTLGSVYTTLVLRQREATKDVDAYFAAEAEAIREAAARVGRDEGLATDWLNDAVKGFLYTQPEVTLWLECPGLRVYAPDASYVFAMKAIAGRPEDLRDLRALRDQIGLTSAADALDIVTRYVPARLLTPRVQYLIEDLFEETDG